MHLLPQFSGARPAGAQPEAQPPSRLRLTLAVLVRGLFNTLLLGSLQAYKLLISPLLGSRCRFHPSCSSYAHLSIERFGPLRGSWLAMRRLARCGPWHPGGIDDVPEHVNVGTTQSS